MFGLGINRAFVQPVETPSVRQDCIVAAYHPRAREIGYSVLENGGNAVDAFIAVVVAENVLAEGASTLAGPLGALVYNQASRSVVYLDADFNDPISPEWKWRARMPRGRAILVPGAPAGFEALSQRYGSLPLRQVLAPALALAEDGFPVSPLMAIFLKMRAKILKRSSYGRETYFDSEGRLLTVGSHLRLPAVASFLRDLGNYGAEHVYRGAWAAAFLSIVGDADGILGERDLRHYAIRWDQPWCAPYGDLRIHSCSGRSYGGLWSLLASNTIQQASLGRNIHYSTDPDALATIVRVARQVWNESWILDEHAISDRALVESRLTAEYAAAIWERVCETKPFSGIRRPGSHSYHIIVVDKEGNAVSGTTTIESDPWGNGMFVQGIPLSPAGAIPWNTSPGARRISPFSTHLVLKNGDLRFAIGAISNSAAETSFQFLLNLIHYELDVEEAVSKPRFGTFPYRWRLDFKRNWLDPSIARRVVKGAEKDGVRFKRRGVIDTGLGCVVSVAKGRLAAAVAPIPYVPVPFTTAEK